MNATLSTSIRQFQPRSGVIISPSIFPRFINTLTEHAPTVSGFLAYLYHGYLEEDPSERICPSCNSRMHRNQFTFKTLSHTPVGNHPSKIRVRLIQYRCPHCGRTHTQRIPFQVESYRMTVQLYEYVVSLLGKRTMTLKQIAALTFLSPQTVAAIDRKILKARYCDSDGKYLKPDWPVHLLGIDEFKLHNGHQFATHIIDLATGRILWIAAGKKKQVVYDFIDHVGMDFMKSIEAVACDMNSDFEEAFLHKCPHLKIVYDLFHIVKYFNEHVADEIRRTMVSDRNQSEGYTASRGIKKTRYLWLSNRKNLQDTLSSGRISKETKEKTEVALRRYLELMETYSIFALLDGVKDQLKTAYDEMDKELMTKKIDGITDCCTWSNGKIMDLKKAGSSVYIPTAPEQSCLNRFAKLLESHKDGILNHAEYCISNGKIEGINNKIKTIRRMCYGLPNDEYFFLRIMDASYGTYEKNPLPHKIIQ